MKLSFLNTLTNPKDALKLREGVILNSQITPEMLSRENVINAAEVLIELNDCNAVTSQADIISRALNYGWTPLEFEDNCFHQEISTEQSHNQEQNQIEKKNFLKNLKNFVNELSANALGIMMLGGWLLIPLIPVIDVIQLYSQEAEQKKQLVLLNYNNQTFLTTEFAIKDLIEINNESSQKTIFNCSNQVFVITNSIPFQYQKVDQVESTKEIIDCLER